MSDIADWLADAYEWLRRRPWPHWVLRAVMLACGLAAQGWIALTAGASFWALLGCAAVVAGAVLPRTLVPLLTAGLLLVEAAAVQLSALALVPLTVALLGWHVCATLLSMGMPWARVGRQVARGFALPVAAALGATAVTVAVALIGSGAELPEAGPLTLIGVLVVLLGGIVVLWPGGQARR